MSACQRQKILPIRAPTKVSLSSFLFPFHMPFFAPSLLFSPSFIPFFLLSHSEASRLERIRVYVQSGRVSSERINVLWEVSGESGLSLSFNVLFFLVLSPRLCLPARRLPAPLELMLCRTQHGQDNDRILRAYIFCDWNDFPFLFCLLCGNGLFLFSIYTLLSSSQHLLTFFVTGVHYIDSQLSSKWQAENGSAILFC